MAISFPARLGDGSSHRTSSSAPTDAEPTHGWLDFGADLATLTAALSQRQIDLARLDAIGDAIGRDNWSGGVGGWTTDDAVRMIAQRRTAALDAHRRALASLIAAIEREDGQRWDVVVVAIREARALLGDA